MDRREYEHLQDCLSNWQHNPPHEFSSGKSCAVWREAVLRLKSILHGEYKRMKELNHDAQK